MSRITVFHNPRCSTSRKVLDRLAERGVTPEVVEYLKTGWTEAQLKGLLKKMGGLRPGDILRKREPLAAELGLTQPGASDEELLAAMVAHPVLVERPILETATAAVLARPVERADALV